MEEKEEEIGTSRDWGVGNVFEAGKEIMSLSFELWGELRIVWIRSTGKGVIDPISMEVNPSSKLRAWVSVQFVRIVSFKDNFRITLWVPDNRPESLENWPSKFTEFSPNIVVAIKTTTVITLIKKTNNLLFPPKKCY